MKQYSSNRDFEVVFKKRTKSFGIAVIKMLEDLPYKKSTAIISNQLMRSASAVGSGYRAACRAKTIKDFIYKLTIVEEESDESLYWIEMLEELGTINADVSDKLKDEIKQILAITVSAIRNTKHKQEGFAVKSELRTPNSEPRTLSEV